jgi:hypothetical protein
MTHTAQMVTRRPAGTEENLLFSMREAFRRLLVLEAGQEALRSTLAEEAFGDIASAAKTERDALIEECGSVKLDRKTEQLFTESTTALTCIHVLAERLNHDTMNLVEGLRSTAYSREVMELWAALQSMIQTNWEKLEGLYRADMGE